jgi:tRNA isopentenyl-2-thiomethyl-A-37 hydroxylase MiaE
MEDAMRLAQVVFALIFFSMAAVAEVERPCSPELPSILELGPLEQLARRDTYFAASHQQVTNSPCRRRRTLAGIKEHLNQVQRAEPKQTVSIRGIELENQNSDLLNAFENLVTRRRILGEPLPNDEQPSLAAARNCKDVICASEAIFGNRVGPKLLFMQQNFGMNGSELAFNNSARLRPDEINSFIRSLDDLPPHLLPLLPNKQMTHFTRGSTLAIYGEDNGVLANATMTFFDGWSDKRNEGDRDMVCTHELGHVLGRQLQLDSHPDWLNLSGWEDLGDSKWNITKPERLVSRYARTNPGEDFAESVTAYRYNPQGLKAVSPEKYEFIKNNVFAGLEYTNERECSKTPQLLARASEEISRLLSHKSARELLTLETAQRECNNSVLREYDDFTRRTHQMTLQQCIEGKIAEDAIKNLTGLTELERESLKRHFMLASANSPDISPIPAQEVNQLARDLHNKVRNDLVDGYHKGILTSAYITTPSCENISGMGSMSDSALEQWGDSLFRARLREFQGSINQNYCEFHQRYRKGRTIHRIDALYFVSQGMRDLLGTSESEWAEIEALHQRRVELLEAINSNSSVIGRAIGALRERPEQTELRLLEARLTERLEGMGS